MVAINKALTLDPNLSEAHSAHCENKYLYEWDFAGAERACRRAIELDPDSPQAHEIYSRYLMGRGRHDEAIAEIKIAIDIDPSSRFYQRNYGRALFYARRFAEASEQLERVNSMDPNFNTYPWICASLAQEGKYAKAFEWFLKLLTLRKADEETVQAFKSAFEASGWHGVLRELLNQSERYPISDYDKAEYHAQLGNKDEAIQHLEKEYPRRVYRLTYIQVDARLDSLRDDPRYLDLVRRISKSKVN
jgi:serine/threonine-protein kinase